MRVLATGLALVAGCAPASDVRELSLAYFMGPSHPMNEAVFAPFAENVAELSGGKLVVQQFAGGALNSSPASQYSMLINGVADIAFALPGYTADLFPKTNLISLPGICTSAIECTDALQRARPSLEGEYGAKVLALWAMGPPVLLTRDRPVRTLEDLRGLKIRVSSRGDIPFIEALGASAVMEPATVLHQNLSTGVLDGIAISPSAIVPMGLYEPANYLTTWLPLSGAALVLIMNRETYQSLSERERGWIDAASAVSISRRGAHGYAEARRLGLRRAEEEGVKIIELTEEQRSRFERAVVPAVEARLARPAGDMSGDQVIAMFRQR